MLVSENNIIAWLNTGEKDQRLEVSYSPDSYPSLGVSTVTLTDEKLAENINTERKGWTVVRCNIDGVNREDDYVAY